MQPMRLLVTGGAGCLGSNLVERYLLQGYEICVIDNFSTANREALPIEQGLKVVEGDIYDNDLVSGAFEEFRPTHVIHSAAAYKDPDDWLEDARTNLIGMINVIRASQASAIKQLINFQTALCYGEPKSTPISIDHGLHPVSSYGISKVAGELYLRSSGLNFVSIRLATVLAPRFVIGAVPTFYKRLKNGQPCFCSDTIRDFLSVNDFFRLIDKILEIGSPSGVFNASPGIGVSMKYIHDCIARKLGVEVEVEPEIIPAGIDDVREVVLDPGETQRVFGWEATESFEEALDFMIDWYESHGLSSVYSHVRRPQGQ